LGKNKFLAGRITDFFRSFVYTGALAREGGNHIFTFFLEKSLPWVAIKMDHLSGPFRDNVFFYRRRFAFFGQGFLVGTKLFCRRKKQVIHFYGHTCPDFHNIVPNGAWTRILKHCPEQNWPGDPFLWPPTVCEYTKKRFRGHLLEFVIFKSQFILPAKMSMSASIEGSELTGGGENHILIFVVVKISTCVNT